MYRFHGNKGAYRPTYIPTVRIVNDLSILFNPLHF